MKYLGALCQYSEASIILWSKISVYLETYFKSRVQFQLFDAILKPILHLWSIVANIFLSQGGTLSSKVGTVWGHFLKSRDSQAVIYYRITASFPGMIEDFME